MLAAKATAVNRYRWVYLPARVYLLGAVYLLAAADL
jgi:hypothetical protein